MKNLIKNTQMYWGGGGGARIEGNNKDVRKDLGASVGTEIEILILHDTLSLSVKGG